MSSLPVTPSPYHLSLGAAEGDEIHVAPVSLVSDGVPIGAALLTLALAVSAAYAASAKPASGSELGLALGAAAIVSLAATIALFVRRARRAFRVQLYQQGFTIGSEAFPIDAVEALAIDETPRLRNGRHAGFDRRIVVRAGERSVDVRHSVGRIDVLGPFVRTLLERATDAAERRLPRGVRGDDWLADSLGFHDDRDLTRYDEITRAGIFDRELRLWRRNDEQPFFAVAIASDNARVLLRLLQSRITQRKTEIAAMHAAPSAPVDAPAAGELGRLLFERRPPRLIAVFTAILALGILGIPYFWMHAQTWQEQVAAACATLLAPLCLVATLHIATSRIRVYDHAITTSSLFGTKTHRYAQSERMTWAEARLYVHGGYQGTTRHVKLYATGQRAPLRFHVAGKGSDEDLNRIRDRIAKRIADRMEKEIAANGRVDWCGVALTSDALEVRRLWKVERIPYATPMRIKSKNGVLRIYRASAPASEVASLRVKAENFFPGFELWQRRAKLVR